jgi:hypothetical protein
MKMSLGWKVGRAARKRILPSSKPKIRWDVLGLQDPAEAVSSVSMEDIRRQVSSLASRGFGAGTRSRSVPKDSEPVVTHEPILQERKRRRGATE